VSVRLILWLTSIASASSTQGEISQGRGVSVLGFHNAAAMEDRNQPQGRLPTQSQTLILMSSDTVHCLVQGRPDNYSQC
jgi:hypothetical protein